MTVDTVTLFLALLAVLAFLTTVAVVLSALFDDPLGLLAQIRPVAIELAAAVAVTATLGSLYLSEVANYDPCRLCWVQRGFMYPAALLLVAGVLAKSSLAARAAGLLAAIGLPVSIFHRYEQAYGGVGSLCEQENPCSLRWVEHFGFMTTPTMAGIGFLTVATLVGLTVAAERRSDRPESISIQSGAE